MRIFVVIHVVGRILRVIGALFLAPIGIAVAYGETGAVAGFVVGSLVTSLAGQIMVVAGREPVEDLRRIEALAVVSGAWLLVALCGAIPYLWAGLAVIDAFFESMSGFTTTGATVLVDFRQLDRATMFWRALTQWLGGMGVITLFVAVLPRLAFGVRQLFFTEAPGPTAKTLTPHVRETAAFLWRLYAGLTAAELVALTAAGMPLFDAACHALTTLAAGGFSPHPLSVMGYQSPAVEWIICLFMFLAGANFALQYRALLGRPGALLRDEEFRAYAGVVLGAAALLGAALWLSGAADAVRPALFQTLSVLTTTGYASVDFALWTGPAQAVLLALMFIGGCAGSAAGGPKVLRHLLVGRYSLQELRRTLHPRAVLPVKLGRTVVSDAIMRGVLVFLIFYVLVFAVTAAVVIGLGADIVTGVTASAATLGNIGPGLGGVGPLASYAGLHPASKLLLTATMWIGRLEIVAVLALLRWEVWRHARWRRSVRSGTAG
ncbi:MAG: TrkH family potassium uptake protein [Acidobacteria bacterium]|nr:TrkH family potassium uptake protein [Acidobacteriota bacterium]